MSAFHQTSALVSNGIIINRLSLLFFSSPGLLEGRRIEFRALVYGGVKC